MGTLASGIADLAGAIRDKINAVTASVNSKVSGVTGTGAISSTGGTAPVISITAATTSAPGSMSAADKLKLDGLSSSGTGTAFAPVSATGTNTANQTVTLPLSTLGVNDVLVLVSGIHQRPTTDYTISSSTLTLIEAVPTGESIIIRAAGGVQGPAGTGGTSLPAAAAAGMYLKSNSTTAGDVSFETPLAGFPILVLARDAGNQGGFQYGNNSQGFQTVQFGNAAVTDTHGGWNSSTNEYTIQQSGTYNVALKLRLDDSTPNVNHGIGYGPANTDSATFVWANFPSGAGSNTNRFVLQNEITAVYTAGQKVKMFTYLDYSSDLAVNKASLTLTRIR